MTLEAVLAAANDLDPETKKGQVCEANFYSGELALHRSAKDDAARLFRLATGMQPNILNAVSGARTTSPR
jgi:lipoprotein NlpI